LKDQALLYVNDLKVFFKGEETIAHAVDGVSYEIDEGETVCLVGESGCGKTVSALSVMGLIPRPPGEIAGGEILYRGRNLLNLNDDQMRDIRGRRIAMVFQEPMTTLNPVFTIGDQIQEAIAAHENIGRRERYERSVRLLKDVGIPSPEERVKDYPHQLSGGQRQRVMIAMALSCNPDLVIADEPTTALDVTIQAQILHLLRKIQQKRPMSILYITHDLGVVSHIADHIYVMYSGIIVEQGDISAIFDHSMHPYTRGLLASLPDRRKRGRGLYNIPGTVPDPAFKPEGCPFHPRCETAEGRCRVQFPEMSDYGGGHLSRCPIIWEKHGKRIKEKG
jgi:oligopeptide/dipeptide ABC transporter ATP-binding protein